MLDGHDRLKLADFGLARQSRVDVRACVRACVRCTRFVALSPASACSSFCCVQESMMRSVVGTMLYSCPEIVQQQPYNAKADVWALGCILYQMATLEAPFAGAA